MIVEYLRPHSIEEALLLLSRATPFTVPLGGGVSLSRNREESIAVVDLQELGLNAIEKSVDTLKIGAAVTLQEIYENPATPQALRDAIRLEMNFNLRQMATIGGLAASAEGLSPTSVVLVTLMAELKLEPGGEMMALENFTDKHNSARRKLITEIHLSPEPNCQFLAVGRTRYDKPFTCAARGSNNSRRVVSSQNGEIPKIFTENEIDEVLSTTYSHNILPIFGSYESEMTKTLIRKLFSTSSA